MNNVRAQESKVRFGLVHNQDSPEELEKQIAKLQEARDAAREKELADKAAKAAAEKEFDQNMLVELHAELDELDEVLGIADKLSLEEAKTLTKQRNHLERQIKGLEDKYGAVQAQLIEQTVITTGVKGSVWPTVAKIAGLLFLCWAIVLYSGEWILKAYPSAAIYNEVSFQKVLFGFSVFIAGITAVILSLSVFFPGIGKYFNPFNREQLDFYQDFKSLTSWERNLISVALFFALLLSFVLTVAGKLD